jgi:hypothetical protein
MAPTASKDGELEKLAAEVQAPSPMPAAQACSHFKLK